MTEDTANCDRVDWDSAQAYVGTGALACAAERQLGNNKLLFLVGPKENGTIGSMARKRLIVVSGAAAIVAVLAVALVPLTHRFGIKTTDFVNFYVGASLVLHGHGAKLYDRQSQDLVLESILGHRSTQYFLHPPFEAAALSPFALVALSRDSWSGVLSTLRCSPCYR